TRASKEEIKAYLEKEFGYDLSRTLDEIRPTYKHVEDCMRTMPEAFTCFLEANSYEECIRNVMYIGGDTDTLGAIAGAVAEAMWGVPESFVKQAKLYLPKEIIEVVDRFLMEIISVI
ncbi:MAG: ADP-ribosylglycohydrolase family protein, partial [Clostridiales bacterium]|nr:ADP-ribosylglycohydrolase family protein [Clostridiales bacterium]